MTPNEKSGNGPETAPPASAGGTPSMLNVNSQYIKDLSFEAPNGMQSIVALQKTQPVITVNLDVQMTPVQEPANTFEVAIHIKAECKIGETIGFIYDEATTDVANSQVINVVARVTPVGAP